MDTKRTRRLLIVAFVLSLLIHLVLSGTIRWPFKPPPDESIAERVSIEKRITIAKAARPPVKAPPSPAATARARVEPLASPRNSMAKLGSARGVAAAPKPVSAAPTPAPSPQSTCNGSDTPVELIAKPTQPPEIPPAARADKVNGVAQIRVVVGPQGNVESANVVASSGSAGMDLVAAGMARDAQYAPATHLCKAIASDFTFSVDFRPW
jgi:TonB family protein